jgi:enoyl-CoA hydratase/carnithine racemase
VTSSTSDTAGLVLVDRSDDVATIRLNRPEKRNALSIALRDTMSAALDELALDETLKALVITGAGDYFSAGFDLNEFALAANDPAVGTKLWASSDRFHHAVLRFPLPTVAAVNGPALAGGFDLAVLCDVRIASTTARFAHPEFTFGDVVFSPLHDLVGGAIARDLALTGRELDATEALALHVVTALAPPEQLAAEVGEVTERICRAPREFLLRSKAKAIARAGIQPATATLDL